MWLMLGAATLIGSSPPASTRFQDTQGAAPRAMAADHQQYFKYYCISVNAGILEAPITREARIQSTAFTLTLLRPSWIS
jgi:hypothetical protein